MKGKRKIQFALVSDLYILGNINISRDVNDL